MTTVTQARGAARALIESGGIVAANGTAVPLRWQNEKEDSTGQIALPDTPKPFVYTEFLVSRSAVIERGAGLGHVRHRHPAQVVAYVFVPKDEGLDEAEAIAEQIAVLFRPYRANGITVEDVTVEPGGDGASITPPGLQAPVGNYFWAACEVSLYFDLIG